MQQRPPPSPGGGEPLALAPCPRKPRASAEPVLPLTNTLRATSGGHGPCPGKAASAARTKTNPNPPVPRLCLQITAVNSALRAPSSPSILRSPKRDHPLPPTWHLDPQAFVPPLLPRLDSPVAAASTRPRPAGVFPVLPGPAQALRSRRSLLLTLHSSPLDLMRQAANPGFRGPSAPAGDLPSPSRPRTCRSWEGYNSPHAAPPPSMSACLTFPPSFDPSPRQELPVGWRWDHE